MSTFTLLLCGDVHTARTGARLPGCSLLLSLSRPLSGPGRPGGEQRAVTRPAAAVRAGLGSAGTSTTQRIRGTGRGTCNFLIP